MTTHAALVARAKSWLAMSQHCRLVATEMLVQSVSETPDAIGWGPRGSILVECKASRSDFRADETKFFRQHPEYGVGVHRYYMTPPGLLQAHELQGGWGLLEAHEHQVRVKVQPVPFLQTAELLRSENAMLISIAWRAMQVAGLVKPITAYALDGGES